MRLEKRSMGKYCLAMLLSCFVCASLPAQTVFVSQGDLWDFFRGREAPPWDWAEPGFDPGAWSWEQGATGIGYADDDDATVLDDMAGQYASVYLRIEFDVPAGLDEFLWFLRVRYDDGFVAYVDGQEVCRRGLTGTPPTYDELATNHEITTAVGFDETIEIGGEGLVIGAGSHVLAAEVHNATLDSTDLSFSAELLAAPFLATAVQPAFGPIEGGNQVTIQGQGFRGADVPQVRFGGVAATAVTVVSWNSLQVTVPPGPRAGLVDVEVEDSRGIVLLERAYDYRDIVQAGLSFAGQNYASAGPFPEDVTEGTFEAWFSRAQEGGFQRGRALLSIQAGGVETFRIETRGNRVRARTLVGGQFQDLDGIANLMQLTWYHLAFTFGPAGQSVYVDGVPLATSAQPVSLPMGAQLRLGSAFGEAQAFMGTVESARLWNVQRTPDEVKRYRYALLEAEDGLVASWPMDDGAGPAAVDVGLWGLPLVLGDSTAAEQTDPLWTGIDQFPLFAVTDVWPRRGSINGGEKIRIYGTGFSEDPMPQVLFGGVASPSIDVLSAWEMEVVAPAGSSFGAVDVEVVTARGSVVLQGTYVYEPANLRYLVSEGMMWRYFIGAYAPPVDWTSSEFDAAAAGWEEGPSGLGYGDGDDATDLPQMQNNNLTLYARTTWEMSTPATSIDYLRLRVRYDDGYVAYLNGNEIARANVAGYPPTYDEAASDLHEITGGAGHFDEEIDILSTARDFLKVGLNVLAVEAHNESTDSSDLSISAELVYSTPGAMFRRGDADADGALTIGDAIRILRYLFIEGVITCLEAADVDNDGTLVITDAIYLLRYLFLGDRAPPPPLDAPGPDLDDDPLTCQG